MIAEKSLPKTFNIVTKITVILFHNVYYQQVDDVAMALLLGLPLANFFLVY